MEQDLSGMSTFKEERAWVGAGALALWLAFGERNSGFYDSFWGRKRNKIQERRRSKGICFRDFSGSFNSPCSGARGSSLREDHCKSHGFRQCCSPWFFSPLLLIVFTRTHILFKIRKKCTFRKYLQGGLGGWPLNKVLVIQA